MRIRESDRKYKDKKPRVADMDEAQLAKRVAASSRSLPIAHTQRSRPCPRRANHCDRSSRRRDERNAKQREEYESVHLSTMSKDDREACDARAHDESASPRIFRAQVL